MDVSERFVVDGVEFVPSWDRPSASGSFTLLKSARMLPRYEHLLGLHPNPRMVELGISQGGSVALLALLGQPAKFVAIELDPRPIDPLIELLEQRGMTDTVRPYFGVDQADRSRLGSIVADEFSGQPLDLVVDDASHLYEPTVASFETLFPHLRPGGTYVIEDWTWQDLWAKKLAATIEDPSAPMHQDLVDQVTTLVTEGAPRERPLSRMALEFALARAHSGGAVAEVTLDEDWIVVRKGDQALDPSIFRLTHLYEDHYGLLTPRAPSPS